MIGNGSWTLRIFTSGTIRNDGEFSTIYMDFFDNRQDEFGGKLKTQTSTEFSTTGVKLTETPASGKTYYLHKARVILSTYADQSFSGEIIIRCQLKMNGVIKDNFAIKAFVEQGAGEGPGFAVSGSHAETIVMGISLDGDGAKTVVVEVVEINGTGVEGFVTLSGFEENTADSPAL